MLMSIPNQANVKYNAVIYPDEAQCNLALEGYMSAYENKSQEFKDTTLTQAFCIPFTSFNIKGIKGNIGA